MEVRQDDHLVEMLFEENRRGIDTQKALPCAVTVPMLQWVLAASGLFQMGNVDG